MIVLVIIFAVVYKYRTPAQPPVTTTTTSQPINTATFACSAQKSITAAFYEGTATPSVDLNTPPTPGGSVALTLSDGRTMTLAQTISADGARYANADGSIVFWNKGNGVTFTENNQQTYTGCIEVVPDPGNLPLTYVNGTEGFSLRYPTGYTVDEAYQYQELGPGKDIGGVKFTIPASLAAGTNLSSDSYVSVEEIPSATACSASLFLDSAGTTTSTVTDNGTTYSMGTNTGAGAGNRYAETVYAIPGTNPCIAVRYYVHYGVIDNYPAGSVKQFDQAALTAQFDAIRRTLTIAQ